jgi:hypothetical protein
MKYAPHIYDRLNPRQPYYGMPNYSGALSWYSRPYVNALLDNPFWESKQSNWASGSASYFDKTNVSNELRYWKFFANGNDFADLILYVSMSMIFEKNQAMTPTEHSYMFKKYGEAYAAGSSDEKLSLIEVILNKLSQWGYPKTYSDLSYTYERYLTELGIDVTTSRGDSSDTNLPPSPLTDEEREETQRQIEENRKKDKSGKPKTKKKTKKKLTKKQKKRIYISSASVGIGLVFLFIYLNRKGK